MSFRVLWGGANQGREYYLGTGGAITIDTTAIGFNPTPLNLADANLCAEILGFAINSGVLPFL